MNDVLLTLLISMVVLMFLCIVFICEWIHLDAKSRGQSGLAWILIVIAASPLVGLLAYLLAGRKEIRVPCWHCGWMISRDARFCERCGTEQDSHALQTPPPEGEKNKKRFLFTAIACFAASVLCIIGVTFAAVRGGNSVRMTLAAVRDESSFYPSPSVNLMSVEFMWDGEWKVSCYYCSDGFLKRSFNIDNPSQESLHTNITCEKGRVFVHVHQGDTKVIYDVTEIQGDFSLPLSEFQPGTIRVMVEVRGIKKLKSVVFVE